MVMDFATIFITLLFWQSFPESVRVSLKPLVVAMTLGFCVPEGSVFSSWKMLTGHLGHLPGSHTSALTGHELVGTNLW